MWLWLKPLMLGRPIKRSQVAHQECKAELWHNPEGVLCDSRVSETILRARCSRYAATGSAWNSWWTRVTWVHGLACDYSEIYANTARDIWTEVLFGSYVATDTGGACSATAIRALIKQFISGENIKKPLSNSQISEILGQQVIVVARRTVSKYREPMQIPPVSLRKSF